MKPHLVFAVIGCYYDKERKEIWFGLNGDWRFRKGLAFSDIDEDLFPAICFTNGTLRVNIKKEDHVFGPPGEADFALSKVATISVVLPARPEKEEEEEDSDDDDFDEKRELTEEEKKKKKEKQEAKAKDQSRSDFTKKENFWGIGMK